MTERDLIEHLYDRLDETRDQRLALYGLALGLLSALDRIARLVPDETMAELEWYHAAHCGKAVDQAVELLGHDDEGNELIAGIDVAALRDRFAVTAQGMGAVR